MHIAFASKPAARATTVEFLTTSERSRLPAGIREAELSLQPNSRALYHASDTLYVGLGSPEKVTADTFRRAAAAAAMALRKGGRLECNLRLENWPEHANPVIEGLLHGSYRFEEFKTVKTAPPEKATIVVKSADVPRARKAAARATVVGEMVNLVRRICNQPGNIVYPATLAEEAQWHSRKFGLRCTVLDEKKLRAKKFGGILAVGQGSARPPRLIVLEHRGGPAGGKPLAFVGKAVTFDTGGISIKPPGDMEKMIWDKCGGVAVLGAMLAISALKLKGNFVGLIPCAENMPSSNAFRPGDIVTCYDGKAVEIINTDAEGRVILGDAIAYARTDLRARAIVDVATLTGACGVALGDSAAGLWSNDEAVRAALQSASEDAGERLWPMPLFPEHEEQIRSEVALIKNTGGRLGGACTAAAYLKTFAENVPWGHLDIAYTSYSDKERPWQARGATGFATRTLVNFAERFV